MGTTYTATSYRLRHLFTRHWSGYLSIALLIGLIGGVAMASVAAGRRTQSAFPVFLASTHPSTLSLTVYQNAANGGPGPLLTAKIERLPGVQRVEAIYAPSLIELQPNGAPQLSSQNGIVTLASFNGLSNEQDRPAILRGRAPQPDRTDEMSVTASAAKLLHLRLGQVVSFGMYTSEQMRSAGFGSPAVKPTLLIREHIVAITAFNTQVVQDDVDSSYGFLFITPALLHKALRIDNGQATPAAYGIELRSSKVALAKVERELVGLVPAGYTYQFHVTSYALEPIQLAVKPESLALEGFGLIAALVCLVLTAQALSRLLRSRDEDYQVLRALGARPVEIIVEGLSALVTTIVAGTILAFAVAVVISPLSPIGAVRPVYPERGFAFDWSVLGWGSLALIVVLGAVALLLTVRALPHRQRVLPPVASRPSKLAHGVQNAGLSIAGVVGVHFAVERGRGRTAVPVRSVMAGTVLAVAMVVTTVTFSSGLGNLISHPALYGWNWDYALNPSNNVPPVTTGMLNRDRNVAAWSGADYTDAQIDGQVVPILLMNNAPRVGPPILVGHTIEASNQVVIGASTLATLHKKIGDTVTVQYGSTVDAPFIVPPTKLKIVGVATFPAVGYASFVAEHTAMGSGALVPRGVEPRAFRLALHSGDPNLNGSEMVFVRLRAGVDPSRGRADMRRIVAATMKVFNADPRTRGNGLSLLGVQRPVQIVNYRSIGSTPLLLALGLAAGAVGALGLTLASSVRKRRRDLAMLKTLGFSRRQVTAAIAWQATVDAIVGLVFGLPIGILAGKELWVLFAKTINAVPDPTVPLLAIALVVAGTLLFTNAVAAIPGRMAARIPIGLILRAE